MSSPLEREFAEHQAVIAALAMQEGQITSVAEALAAALDGGGTVFWCGNGGSAADAQHLAAELVVRFERDRRPLRSLALTTDTSVLTATANDLGVNQVFARQVAALARSGDVLVCLSTSGNSPNVVAAAHAAREVGARVIAITGAGGGALLAVADIALCIPSQRTSRIQEATILVGHVLCGMLEERLR